MPSMVFFLGLVIGCATGACAGWAIGVLLQLRWWRQTKRTLAQAGLLPGHAGGVEREGRRRSLYEI